MRVIFLHIPKTAGQSVHAALATAFGREAVCPARSNEQLAQMSVSTLHKYRVFSGHLDWSMLDCLEGPKFTFTVLREPLERVLSLYFYLRKKAEAAKPDERSRKHGSRGAFELSPTEYFLGGKPKMRAFLDDNYDNFYTYYFASRQYRARSRLAAAIRRGDLTREQLLANAKNNMARLDAVYSIDDMDAVFDKIRTLGDRPIREEYRGNTNPLVAPGDRLAALRKLGADASTEAQLLRYCDLDRELWNLHLKPASPGTA